MVVLILFVLMSSFSTINNFNALNFNNFPSSINAQHPGNYGINTPVIYNVPLIKKSSSCCPQISNHSIPTDVSSSLSNSQNEEIGSIHKDGLCCGTSVCSDSSDQKKPDIPCQSYVQEMVHIINYSPEILNKVQEYNKLCRQAQEAEKAIKVLLLAKNSKKSRIEDLRCLLRRISTEESFSSCCFVGKTRSFEFTSRDKKIQDNKENGSTTHISTTIHTSNGDACQESTTESSTICEADGDNEARGDKANPGCFNSYYHFNMCSMYWQELLPVSMPSLLSSSACKQA